MWHRASFPGSLGLVRTTVQGRDRSSQAMSTSLQCGGCRLGSRGPSQGSEADSRKLSLDSRTTLSSNSNWVVCTIPLFPGGVVPAVWSVSDSGNKCHSLVRGKRLVQASRDRAGQPPGLAVSLCTRLALGWCLGPFRHLVCFLIWTCNTCLRCAGQTQSPVR